MSKGVARFVAVDIGFQNEPKIRIYASPRVADALRVIGEMPSYEGVKIEQLLKAVYRQGKRDGARLTLAKLAEHMKQLYREVPHRVPGRPRKLIK